MVEKIRAKSKLPQTEKSNSQPEWWRANQLYRQVEPNLRQSEKIERKINFLTGAAANSFARRILSSHKSQFQNEGNKELVCPVPEFQAQEEIFNQVEIVDEKYVIRIEIETYREGSWNDRKKIALPVLLNDRNYVLKSATDQLYVVFDHEDSFLPYEETYRVIKKEKVEVRHAFNQILSYFSQAGRNSNQFLADHQSMAESCGLDLGITSRHKTYYGQSRIHVYLAGHNSRNPGQEDDLLLAEALRRGFKIEQKFTSDQEKLEYEQKVWQQFWMGLADGTSLISLLRMDVNFLPGIYGSENLKQLVARVIVAHFFGRSKSLNEAVYLPEEISFPEEVIADYVVRLIYLAGWQSSKVLEELFFSEEASLKVRQIAFGLLSSSDKLGFLNENEALDFLEANHKITATEREKIVGCLKLEKELDVLPKLSAVNALSRNGADFLGLHDTEKNLHDATKSIDYRLAAESVGSPRTSLSLRRNEDFSHHGLRLENLEKPILDHFPTHDLAVKDRSAWSKTRNAPLWSIIFGYDLELPGRSNVESFLQMLANFQDAMQILHVQNLIPPEFSLTIINFWANIVNNINLDSDQSEFFLGAEKLLKQLSSKLTDSGIGRHNNATAHLKDWLGSSIYLERMRVFWQRIQQNGYPLFPHAEDGSLQEGLKISAKNLPLHLAIDRTKRFDSAVNNLEFYLHKAKELNESSCEHIAVRMSAIQLHPNQVYCKDHRYTDDYKDTIWFEWETSAFTKKWIKENWQELVGEAGEVEYRTNAAEVGTKIYQIINRKVEELLAQAGLPENKDKRNRLLYQAYQLANVIYELDRTWEKPIAGRNVHFGICAWHDEYNQIRKSLREIIDLATKEKVKPPGAIEMIPGQIHCLLGPNMGGKSTVMRQVGFGILAHNQGLPQVGGRFDAGSEIFIDSPVGSERQSIRDSLFTQGAKDLGEIIYAKKRRRQNHLWMFDEFGRRTNARYGQANLITASIIAASSEGKPKDMALMATHYQALVNYQALFQALGLELVFWKVEDFKLKKLEPNEQVKSLAIQTIVKHLPKEEYADWPDQDDLSGAESMAQRRDLSPERQKFGELSREQIFALTRDDLMGKSFHEKVIFVSRRFSMSADEAQVFLGRYLVPEKVLDKQKIIQAVIENNQLEKKLETFKDCRKIADFYSSLNKVEVSERKNMLRDFFKKYYPDQVDSDVDINEFYKQIDVFLEKVVAKANTVLNWAAKLIDKVVPGWFTNRGYLININNLKDGRLSSGMYELGAVVSYARQIKSLREKGLDYSVVEFSDEAVFKADEAWNPNLFKKEVVANSFNYDFSDGKAGVVTTGENGSGKSNHQITVGHLGMEAMCLGFGTARSIVANKKLSVLALTQPVVDTMKESSMSQEVSRRISRAVAVAKYSQDPTLVLLDEPGSPTSENDAQKIILWLFEKFLKNSNAKIEVSTHCDGLVDALDDKVYFQAFRLLSDQPFKAFAGTADSNALEVAKAYGLDETFYEIAKIVYEFIVLTKSDKDLIAMYAQEFAAKIREIMQEKIFTPLLAEAEALS